MMRARKPSRLSPRKLDHATSIWTGHQSDGARLLVRGVIEEVSLPWTAGIGANDSLLAHEAFNGLVGKSVGVDGGAIVIGTLATALRT